MDITRENKSLEKKLKSLSIDLNINIEYMVRNMPQQNSPVEQGFIIICSRVKTVFSTVNIYMQVRYLFF